MVSLHFRVMLYRESRESVLCNTSYASSVGWGAGNRIALLMFHLLEVWAFCNRRFVLPRSRKSDGLVILMCVAGQRIVPSVRL